VPWRTARKRKFCLVWAKAVFQLLGTESSAYREEPVAFPQQESSAVAARPLCWAGKFLITQTRSRFTPRCTRNSTKQQRFSRASLASITVGRGCSRKRQRARPRLSRAPWLLQTQFNRTPQSCQRCTCAPYRRSVNVCARGKHERSVRQTRSHLSEFQNSLIKTGHKRVTEETQRSDSAAFRWPGQCRSLFSAVRLARTRSRACPSASGTAAGGSAARGARLAESAQKELTYRLFISC